MDEATTIEKPYSGRLSVPEETYFYYSPVGCLLSMAICLSIAIGIGFFLFNNFSIEGSNWVAMLVGTFLFCLYSYFSIDLLRNSFNKDVQLSISNKGIYTATNGFHEWEYITEESIQTEGHRYRKTYLYYVSNHTPVKIDFGFFNTTSEKLDNLLRVYRTRYEQQKTTQNSTHS